MNHVQNYLNSEKLFLCLKDIKTRKKYTKFSYIEREFRLH